MGPAFVFGVLPSPVGADDRSGARERVFALNAGLLFGPTGGVAAAISATTVSAVLASLLVRALGRTAVQARMTHPRRRPSMPDWPDAGSFGLSPRHRSPWSTIAPDSRLCAHCPTLRLRWWALCRAPSAAVSLGDALSGQPNRARMVVTLVCVAVKAGRLADRHPSARIAGHTP